MNTQVLFFWLAVALYGLSAFSFIFGLISRSEKLFSVGAFCALIGFLCNVLSVAVHWISTGYLPFIKISESITSGVLVAVLIFLVVQFTMKRVRPAGALVMPVVFVLLGWAGTLMKEISGPLSPALQSYWLWVHIVAASTGFSAVLMAAGLALMYLLKQTRSGGIYDKLPDTASLDNMGYRFIAGGFIMLTLMIISGAFWSNQVKGNYWNWDPVEVWSLVSWLIYGLYLHLRITLGWRGRRLAWYAMFALAVMVVSYWGVPFAINRFHSGFRIQHLTGGPL
jgi:cytochrome c-type biogenesis protein CcsB